jgi:hypothetical protein
VDSSIREFAPVLLGSVIAPALILLFRKAQEHTRFLGSFLPAILLGACTSFFAGELVTPTGGAIAVMIDSSLVFTGITASSYLIWGPAIQSFIARREARSTLKQSI